MIDDRELDVCMAMNHIDPQSISPADRQALDALVAHGFNADGLPKHLRPRGQRVMELLGLLEHLPAPSTGDLLVARTLQRIEQARHAPPTPAIRPSELSEQDRQAVDLMVEHGFELEALPAGVPGEVRRRAQAVAGLLSVLDRAGTAQPSANLVERTLARIDDARQRERFTQHIRSMASGPSAGPGVPLGVRWPELIAVAAMLLIGVSLLWPVLNHSRATARLIADQSNLMALGMGFASYANDFNGVMPATRLQFGQEWWNVNKFDEQGHALSNSAHLFQLYKQGYVKLGTLNCPENPDAPSYLPEDMDDWPTARALSYSYQNQYSLRKPKLDGSVIFAIVADKNPFFAPGEYRMYLKRDTSSLNHARLGGQNVLMSNGTVYYLMRPRINAQDNIFHVGDDGLDNYTGVEGPATPHDTFLVSPETRSPLPAKP